MKILCIGFLLLHVTLSARYGARQTAPMENFSSNLSNDLYRQQEECNRIYDLKSEQAAGAGAQDYMDGLERQYDSCKSDLHSKLRDYLTARAQHDGKSVKEWLQDESENVGVNKELRFDHKLHCYVLKVNLYGGRNPAFTYVYLPDEYNPDYKPPERTPLRLRNRKSSEEDKKPSFFRNPVAAIKAQVQRAVAAVKRVFAFLGRLFWRKKAPAQQ